ncbi:MAG: hypothetical protein WBD22_07775 [Pyrinomonadaceae bacterium]
MDEVQNEAVDPPTPIDYAAEITRQETLVDRLNDEHKNDPSPELALELKQNKDALLHLKNLALEDPKVRAQAAAETAMRSARSKAFA